MAAGKNNPQLQQRVAAAAAVGLGPNANWAQIQAAQRAQEQARQAAAQRAAYEAQVAEYNRQVAQRAEQIRQQQAAIAQQQAKVVAAQQERAAQPPDAQPIGPTKPQAAEAAPEPQSIGATSQMTGGQGASPTRRRSTRASLLSGNTGGYNPATGGGRLGGMMRSLLG